MTALEVAAVESKWSEGKLILSRTSALAHDEGPAEGRCKSWQPHEKNGPVLLQNVTPTPLGTHEHSRAHFSILRLRTPKQGVPKALEQPHEKKGGHLEIGTWPRLKCTFYEQNLVLQNQPYFSRFMEGEAEIRAATRRNSSALLQNVALTAMGTHGPRMV